MKSLTLNEIAKAVNGKISNNSNNVFITGVTTDTRNVKENDIFIPIKGERFDGHDFILQAFEKGAICSLSCENIVVPEGKYIIYVEDTRKALRDLAQYYRLSFPTLSVVAITGSVGKTTTKDIIASVLSQKFNVLKTEGNFNNEIGLPLTVFNLNENHEVAVLEMGMNNFGEISRLSKIAHPDIAVITNIGVSHIENLGSREGILKAKCEIFDYFKNGLAVLNVDDDMLITIDKKLDCSISWFGIENKRDIYTNNIEYNGINSINCTICTPKGNFDVSINIPGKHMIFNAMSATAVGLHLGLTLEQIKKGIEEFTPTKMRMSVIELKNNTTIINDSYNANPISMKSAIDVLAKAKKEKIAILGDMLELGDFADNMHYEVGEYAAIKGIDKIICIGELSKNIYNGSLNKGGNVYYFKTKDEFFKSSVFNQCIGNTVLIKASRVMNFEKIAEKLQEVE